MLTVSFPDPSVRCSTGKYCAHQYWKKHGTHRGRVSHGGTGQREMLPQPRHATTLALSRDGNPSSSETSSDGDIVTDLRQMDFSLFILTLALLASVLVHSSFSALIFNLCLIKMVFCGHFISDQADTLLRATSKEVSNMSIGRDNVNTI